MPRPGEYTPQRRRAMQAIMWILLASTVALAAVVSRSVNRANRVDLSPQPISARDVSVRLPIKWRVKPAASSDDPRVIAQAVEPDTDRRPGRLLRVMVDRIDTPVSPLEYLAEYFDTPLPSDVAGEDADYTMLSTVAIAGHPGALVTLQQMQPDRRPGAEGMMIRKDAYGCVVLPSMQVIVVHLSGQYTPTDATDQELIHQIAGAITLSAPAQFEREDSVIRLPLGIDISPPRQWGAVVQTDPLRTDRLLWRRLQTTSGSSGEKFNENWTTAEVVGCLFPRLDPADPKRQERAASALRTMLLTREAGWRDAVVSDVDGVWRAKRAIAVASGDQSFAATAYLLPDASGRALLAIFHGGWSNGAEFDELWKQLKSQTKFLPSSDIAQLEDAGTAEAGRLRREDPAKLIPDRDEQWWLWTDQSDRPHVGWSSLRWQAGKLAADVDLRMRGTAGEIQRITGQWELRGELRDPRSYVIDVTGTQSQGERSITVQQKTTLQHNTLTISFRSAKSLVKEWRTAPPPQYIPGALLTVILGQLQPGPMLLKTESFVDCQLVASPEPLTVTIRPGPTTTRKAEGDEHPMRCVTAEVNGTGRLSRWYFRSTGELECIELAGGVQCTPSDSKSIQFNFGKDGAMAP